MCLNNCKLQVGICILSYEDKKVIRHILLCGHVEKEDIQSICTNYVDNVKYCGKFNLLSIKTYLVIRSDISMEVQSEGLIMYMKKNLSKKNILKYGKLICKIRFLFSNQTYLYILTYPSNFLNIIMILFIV